ncbi:hypothetical protein NON20_11920 [Synechocystis sp. B12]|nr:hypothetical protein NON20_11920 [Synechocystis sp. B12]
MGLFLADSNFLIGIALVFVGVFSLLKLSWHDVQTGVEKVKGFFAEKQ